MADEFDFSELRNYLIGQMDLGEVDLFLDEPWTLTRKNAPTVPMRTAPPPLPPQHLQQAPIEQFSNPPHLPPHSTPVDSIPDTTGFAPSLFGALPSNTAARSPNMPTPRAIKRSVSAFEAASSLDEFYKFIKSEALYAKEGELVTYTGPDHPKLLFLLPALKPGVAPSADFFATPVGEMLSRLFASLNYQQADIGITYFFKSTERPLTPLLEAALRKMLTKELSFIQPQIMVTFGQPLFYQVFGRGKNFDNQAGTAMDFAGTTSCALVDPYAMVGDKQMKWLTWKIHIPRSKLFTVKV